MGKLFGAWEHARSRGRWLKGGSLQITKANPGKNIRARWDGGKSSLDIRFYPKGAGKCQVTVDHTRLSDSKAAAKMKKYWAEKLEALAALVS